MLEGEYLADEQLLPNEPVRTNSLYKSFKEESDLVLS